MFSWANIVMRVETIETAILTRSMGLVWTAADGGPVDAGATRASIQKAV